MLKILGRALEINSNIANAAASWSPKAALSSLPAVTNFYHTGKVLDLGKFIYFYTIWMHQKTQKVYPTAPLENNDLEQRLEEKLKNVNSFRNSINIIKE